MAMLECRACGHEVTDDMSVVRKILTACCPECGERRQLRIRSTVADVPQDVIDAILAKIPDVPPDAGDEFNDGED
jgi:transcription elongation factor Elf1